MWQLLLFAAVAGSTGYATKHFLSNHPPNKHPHPVEHTSNVEHNKAQCRRKLRFCFNKRKKTNKSNPITVASNPAFSSPKDNSIFGWGFSFGIMYMMSAGKAEITKLNKTLDKAAEVIQELKSELSRRKSACNHQILDSAGDIDIKFPKLSGRHDELMPEKTNSELRDTDVKIWSPAVNDGGEGGSSTLTEEPDPHILKMDQLEAELEFELQKLSGCTIDRPCHEEIRPKVDENEDHHGTDDLNLNYSQSPGVSASELNQKLSHLLIKQQENQIAELESELQLAQSNLHHKEAELQALMECLRQLTELSLSTVSDDETQALTDPKEASDLDNKIMESESRQSVVGLKRPIDSEWC